MLERLPPTPISRILNLPQSFLCESCAFYLPVFPDQASSDLLILRLFSLCLK